MAVTTFATGHPLTQTQWSKNRFAYHLKKNIFIRTGAVTMQADVNGAVQFLQDLRKEPGDKVRVSIKNPLTSPGVGNAKILENPERLYFDYDQVTVNTLGHSVAGDIPLPFKRTGINFHNEGVDSLMKWLSKRLEILTINGYCGLYNESTAIDVLNEVEPSSNRIVYGGCALDSATINTYDNDSDLSASGLESSTLCTTDWLRYLLRLIDDFEPQFIPFEREGDEMLQCYLHPLHVKSLRACDDWKDIQKYANVRGSKNPFFTDSLGRIQNLMLYKAPELPMRTGAGGTLPAEGFNLDTARTATEDAVDSGQSVAAGFIIGQQSMIWAISQAPRYWYDSDDGFSKRSGGGEARMPLIGLDMILGIKKVQFKDKDDSSREDYGVLVFHTQVQPD